MSEQPKDEQVVSMTEAALALAVATQAELGMLSDQWETGDLPTHAFIAATVRLLLQAMQRAWRGGSQYAIPDRKDYVGPVHVITPGKHAQVQTGIETVVEQENPQLLDMITQNEIVRAAADGYTETAKAVMEEESEDPEHDWGYRAVADADPCPQCAKRAGEEVPEHFNGWHTRCGCVAVPYIKNDN